jgi:hypothetical protein
LEKCGQEKVATQLGFLEFATGRKHKQEPCRTTKNCASNAQCPCRIEFGIKIWRHVAPEETTRIKGIGMVGMDRDREEKDKGEEQKGTTLVVHDVIHFLYHVHLLLTYHGVGWVKLKQTF